jgi:gamma-glutamyl-gamma-aminobutyrate hydrolase PuuD
MDLSARDIVEWSIMKQAVKQGVPIIGVCRGAQILCALAGGFLIQDTNNHGGYHLVDTKEKREAFYTNSTHHQMMYPFDVKHEMLASLKVPIGTYHLDVDEPIEIPEEPEMVFFPEVKGLACQWHPECMEECTAATTYLLNAVKEKLNVGA